MRTLATGVTTVLMIGGGMVASGLATAHTSPAARVHVARQRPVDRRPPTISGRAAMGELVHADHGRWTGLAGTFSYSWQRCNVRGRTCRVIRSARLRSYRVARSDVGHTLRVSVRARNRAGTSVATSAPSRKIMAGARIASVGPKPSRPGGTSSPLPTVASQKPVSVVQTSPAPSAGPPATSTTSPPSPGGSGTTGPGAPPTSGGSDPTPPSPPPTSGGSDPTPPITPSNAVGAAGYSPAPCTETLSPSQADSTPYPGANLQKALSTAPGGAVICLQAGDYDTTSQVDLYGIAPSSNVILEPAPGAKVHLGFLDIANTASDLTVQGLYLDGGASVTGADTNVAFIHDTISGSSTGLYFYGNGHQQTGISVLDNQMDHLAPTNLSPPGSGQCVFVSGGAGTEHDFTVQGNTCGPGIANHYTQFSGIDGLVEDDNTFLGPAAAEALALQKHNNVLQIFGNADNIDFSNNIVWETDSRGQTVLLEEGAFSNVTVNNNLWREDPACLSNSNCYSYAFAACSAKGLSFTNNTIIDSYWGIDVTNSVTAFSDGTPTGCAATGSDYTVTHNVVVGAPGGHGIHYGECSNNCTFDYNVSSDQSAGSGNAVVNWTPQWQDTISYQPLGLPFAAGSTL